VVADNTSAPRFVVGGRIADARSVDLHTMGIVLEKNGVPMSFGAGAPPCSATLPPPWRCSSTTWVNVGRHCPQAAWCFRAESPRQFPCNVATA
jgi:hypothetical protein